MSARDEQAESSRRERISAAELALRVGVTTERVEHLAGVRAIEADDAGRFDSGDVHRVRLLDAFEDAGVPLEALLAASNAGAISLAYYDLLHPSSGPVSDRTYSSFAATLGPRREYLSRLFACFGLAEPDGRAHLTEEDEEFLSRMLDIVVATGQPDLALRAIRMFGESARRAADTALGVYGEAAARAGRSVEGLPVDEVFDRLLRPWARFARQSATLAAWLASRHLSRAIDQYSVAETERTLEDAGFVAPRADVPPAVAFIDLTGFTRLTEERGDEVAAGIALRLGDITAQVVDPVGGRVVKLLGDGVIVRFGDPLAAVDGSLDVLAELPRSGLPTGHAGLAAGPLITREGDIFGRTVNLAARVAEVAPDGRLYAPASVAPVLPAGRYRVTAAGSGVLQGIGHLPLVDVTRSAS